MRTLSPTPPTHIRRNPAGVGFFFNVVFVVYAVAGLSGQSYGQANTSASKQPAKIDTCSLLTREDVASVQSDKVTAVRASEQVSGDVTLLQCYYTAANFTKSVSLLVGVGTDSHSSAAEYLRKQLARESDADRDSSPAARKGEDDEDDEHESGGPPVRVLGVGDDAYWVGNNISSSLYVLVGDNFLRVSLGGSDDRETKMRKSKELAQRALKRMKAATVVARSNP